MTAIAQLPTVLLATSTYSLLHRLVPHLLPPSSPPSTRDRLHSLLSSALALRLVTLPEWTQHDLIHTPSAFGDRIVALELGYLLAGQSLSLLRWISESKSADGSEVRYRCAVLDAQAARGYEAGEEGAGASWGGGRVDGVVPLCRGGGERQRRVLRR